MSATQHVVGIVPADKEYKKKFSLYKACEEAGYTPPKELLTFFDPHGDGIEPDPLGIKIYLPYEEYTEQDGAGVEIDLAKLDPRIKIVRVYQTY